MKLTKEITENRIPKLSVYENEPMSLHTTFKVGGPARIFVLPKNEAEITAAVNLCKEYKEEFFILGKGSDLLVSDDGFDGIIICVDELKNINSVGNCIIAETGASLVSVSNLARQKGLTGLEFACGIPGSVGGAVYMNAGAYGGEIKDVLKSVKVITADGCIRNIPGGEMDLSYRHSRAMNEKLIILEAVFELEPGNKSEIETKVKELLSKRAEKQPLEYPSAGSTFKRPEGYFAGALIEQAGLRGYSLGGAQVSEKHCGFVINKGDATAADIMNLCKYVQKKVYENSKVNLEMEIQTLGKF